MEKLKELANDPAKLDAKLKEDWAKIDPKGEGSVPIDTFGEAAMKVREQLKLYKTKEVSEEDKEKYRKLLDPDNTGRITFENFEKFVKSGLEKLKGK